MKIRGLLWSALPLLLAQGCGVGGRDASQLDSRRMTAAEAQADLGELVGKIKALYGPLEYKKRKLGLDLDAVSAEATASLSAARSDEELLGTFAKLLARLDDAHVSIKFPMTASGVSTYSIPIFVVPVEDRAIVSSVDEHLADLRIARGDELLSVDGQAPFDLLKTITQYRHLANRVSDKQLLYQVLWRPAYMTELTPRSASAHLVLARPDGARYEVDATWHTARNFTPTDLVTTRTQALDVGFGLPFAAEYNQAAAGMDQMGATLPFFLTDAVRAKLGIMRVNPSLEQLERHGVDTAHIPDIYAGLYRYAGKTVLLVRQARYSQAPTDPSNEEYLKAYAALLEQFEGVADVLVLDQTHNPGGSYCEDFFTLFSGENKGGFVQAMHADRKWNVDLRAWATEMDPTLASETARSYLAIADAVDAAYSAGEALTPPQPLMSGRNVVKPYAKYNWRKPFLVLVDELSASCGDAFPALVKNDRVAPIFGERTMGAGGNVEPVTQLPNSQATVSMTRGLFTTYKADGVYTDADFVENHGVTPDLPYRHTVADFRAGFVGYADAFSAAAVRLVP
jgi:hypothetical protein